MRIEQNLYKALSPYIIEAALPMVMARVTSRRIRLDFSDRDGRILGFYRGKVRRWFKRSENRIENWETISLQISLNPYALLLVFVHEWAHLLTHRDYPDAQAHGREWKRLYRQEVQEFLRPDIFPEEMLIALTAYFKKPGAYWDDRLASACAPYGEDRRDFERIYRRSARQGVLLPAPVTYRMALGAGGAATVGRDKGNRGESVDATVHTSGGTDQTIRHEPVRYVTPPVLTTCPAGDLTPPVRVKVQDRWAGLEQRRGDYLTGRWEDTGRPMRVHASVQVDLPAEAAAGAVSGN